MLWALLAASVALCGLLGLLVATAMLVTRGALTVDLGWGRRVRPLGPFTVHVAAPREVVFDVAAVPYASPSPPRAVREKVTVLERGAGLVVAAHRTPTRFGTAVTVETVTLERPERIGFRLLRGPVPHVVERFTLAQRDGGTDLEYAGELGTDLWWLGGVWGGMVAKQWERAVESSLQHIAASAEDLAARREARQSGS